jgi:hypothetical protein
MNVPILIQSSDRQYTAALMGAPDISATGPTREEAIAGLREIVRRRVDRGEISSLEFDDWLDLAGKYHDDPVLDEICDEAYRARNADVN